MLRFPKVPTDLRRLSLQPYMADPAFAPSTSCQNLYEYGQLPCDSESNHVRKLMSNHGHQSNYIADDWGYMGLETKVAFFITQCNEIFT